MQKKISLKRIAFLFAFLFFFTFCIFDTHIFQTHAEEKTNYTNVLDDLRKDESFDEANYPEVADDYSLKVIQVAESTSGELFVYVYQPNEEHGKYIASTINISATEDNSLNIINYTLSLVNFDGVFQKYLVTGISLPTSTTRYYEIISIYRVFDENIDKSLEDDNDNTINEVSYAVGKLYTLTDTENDVLVKLEDIEIIKVTEKYVGFMRYPSNSFSFGLGYDSFDVHYVAFSTDKKIEKLLEAEIYYKTQSYHRDNWSGDEYGSIKTQKAKFSHTDNVEISGTGWFSNTYKWNTIETGQAFVDSEHAKYSYSYGIFDSTVSTKMTSEELANYIGSCDWVLRFATTEYEYWENGKGDHSTVDYTIVSDVSILRLKFETDGVVYNLGVIDNKQSGDLIPDNETKTELGLNDMFQTILVILLLILLAVFFGPILLILFSLVVSILKFLLKIIIMSFKWFWKIFVFLLCLPYRVIRFLFKGIKKGK